MTYSEIISQVAQKLGHSGFSNELKANYRYAILFAEQELFQYANILKRDETLTLDTTKDKYDLPYDYNEPCKFVFKDTVGGMLDAVNVARPEFMTIRESSQEDSRSENELLYEENETRNTQDDARYNNKLIYSVDFQDGFYVLYVKPKINGTVELYYAAVPIQNLYQNLEREPLLPIQYHDYIIYGAVAYLAESEASKAAQAQDYAKSNFFTRLAKDMDAKFRNQKETVTSNASKQPEPGLVKPFTWFDNPRRYR